ncbi:2Fe-2S iron-sulfur cluster-binding protein [Propionivibrio dicarboxylicus]|uniref:CDP-4-dehydro-6-deoxyglucose reductase n=1 Tax=Propionivibrio dicarboxylicus TaxID=83767 RepID=A0A1G7WW34_9RHOO|nr:2Fe-2S iron-sulfur cluster-binding protein [Propionivibrio dicarboxylicus]SDG75490.1 CDP-4-dehydro-6-deoxyglucose reductase [Propionivibrio dicarboxylicus]
MVFRIKHEPGGQTFDGDENETILGAALRAGITLPYGCRTGHCGACRGGVLQGEVDHGETSPFVLGEAERAQGQALFCCARPRSDLRIESRAPALAADQPPRLLPARVERLERVAPDVMRVELKLPGSEAFSFRPGQYVDILLSGGRRRAFSLASAPGGTTLELHIRRIRGGEFTGHVFDGLKLRDLVRIHGPHGSFGLHEASDKPAIFVVRGTGFAPVKAILEAELARGLRRDLILYRGGRQRQDLYFDALVRDWAAAHPAFRYEPVLSAPAEADAWTGRTGSLDAAVLADFPDLSGCEVYACGSPALVTAVRERFLDAGGLPAAAFFADAFAFSGDVVRPRSSVPVEAE